MLRPAPIYGTRASGGVILVTTRMGQIGAPAVSYTGEFTTETVRRKAEVLSADEWIAHGQADRGGRTDWFDAITRTPFTQRHIVTMSGGTKNFSAYASLFYKNAQGMTIRSDKREIGGRFNFKFLTLNDRLELSGAPQLRRFQSEHRTEQHLPRRHEPQPDHSGLQPRRSLGLQDSRRRGRMEPGGRAGPERKCGSYGTSPGPTSAPS